MKKSLILVIAVILLAGCASSTVKNSESTDKVAYETINAAIVGDRVLSVAADLGYMPKVISVRASQWPKAKSYPSKIIGCPVKIGIKDKTILPAVIDKFGLDTVLVEKNDEFCILMKKANCMKVVPLVKDKNVKVEVFDFSKSTEEGIISVAKYFGKEKEGKKLAKKYSKDLAKAEKNISLAKSGKKVVVLNGTVKKETGRVFVRGESKGFYTDKYFLGPFKCVNVTDRLNVSGNEVVKGAFPVFDFSALKDANPDVIVLFGPVDAIKKLIDKAVSQNPELKEVPAIKNNKIFTDLPLYIGSDVLEYPEILTKWINAFSSL